MLTQNIAVVLVLTFGALASQSCTLDLMQQSTQQEENHHQYLVFSLLLQSLLQQLLLAGLLLLGLLLAQLTSLPRFQAPKLQVCLLLILARLPLTLAIALLSILRFPAVWHD